MILIFINIKILFFLERWFCMSLSLSNNSNKYRESIYTLINRFIENNTHINMHICLHANLCFQEYIPMTGWYPLHNLCNNQNLRTNSRAERVVASAGYGAGSGKVWLDELRCPPSSQGLFNCTYRGWGISSDSHNEDVGVDCMPGKEDIFVQIVTQCHTSICINPRPVHLNCTQAQIIIPIWWFRVSATDFDGVICQHKAQHNHPVWQPN